MRQNGFVPLAASYASSVKAEFGSEIVDASLGDLRSIPAGIPLAQNFIGSPKTVSSRRAAGVQAGYGGK